jgi:hypothetical protein
MVQKIDETMSQSDTQNNPYTILKEVDLSSAVIHLRNFHFSPHGKKIKLSTLALRCGPMNLLLDTCVENGIRPIVTRLSADNASKLRFDTDGYPHSLFGENIDHHVTLYGGVTDLRKQLLLLGCSDKGLSDLWLNNHYRWICWKLAATERRFPQVLAGKYLTYEHVLLQLHRRHQVELISGRRPILRRILNRDIAASHSMILCVSKITRRKNRKPEGSERKSYLLNEASGEKVDEITIELTDGWYGIAATMDQFLQEQVRKGKIVVGCKLLVSNAVLEGSDDGIDPLDSVYVSSMKSVTVRLKISANSTRMASWAAKLGLIKSKEKPHESPFKIKSLKGVVHGGGAIPFILLVISKRYPILYMEQTGHNGLKHCKNTDTCAILSSEDEEYRAQVQARRLERFIDDVTENAHHKATQVKCFCFCFYVKSLLFEL